MDIKEIISNFNHLTETEHDRKVRVLREEYLRKEETGENMLIPGEYFYEVMFGEKPDPTCLVGLFNEKGEYIGPDLPDPPPFEE